MSDKTAPEKEPTTGEHKENEDLSPANVRHTLRTPLNHIIGYSEMLLEEAGDRGLEEFTADLQKIHKAGKQLLGFINEFFERTTAPDQAAAYGSKTAAPPADSLFRESRPDARSASVSRPPPQGRILVVDDNESNRDMLSRRLQHEGYDVCVAGSGHEALTLLGAQSIDLVLLDVMMPEMDGCEVLVKLKEDGRWRDLPVIMISALDEIASVVRCIERGAEDYLPKPFDPVLLRARIGACLEKKRLRDQEISYLRDVGDVTRAAAAVEAGQFATEMLGDVGKRPDELGQLARVFERMAREIAAREEQLKRQIQVLSIEIDQAKKAHQVSEITETEYFQDLRKRAKELRLR
ncbi:MAG TPA: response regulator [Candidatus Binatia bacterium]|nr:response regulator [Candidatus Binatia bacterium]